MQSTKKLHKDNYDRPKYTFTDKLTKEEIDEKLEDYVLVKDIYKVPLGTHLRYFKLEKDKKKFRMGGILSNNVGLPNFVVLSNGVNSWSVQVEDTEFFKKMTLDEIKASYEKIINELKKRIENLKFMVNHLKEENQKSKK